MERLTFLAPIHLLVSPVPVPKQLTWGCVNCAVFKLTLNPTGSINFKTQLLLSCTSSFVAKSPKYHPHKTISFLCPPDTIIQTLL